MDVDYVTNSVGQSISSITMNIWNIENKLGKHDFSYGSVVKNLKDRKFFSNQMNRNCLVLTLARHDRNFCSMKLWYPNSAVNETF